LRLIGDVCVRGSVMGGIGWFDKLVELAVMHWGRLKRHRFFFFLITKHRIL